MKTLGTSLTQDDLDTIFLLSKKISLMVLKQKAKYIIFNILLTHFYVSPFHSNLFPYCLTITKHQFIKCLLIPSFSRGKVGIRYTERRNQ